jgi:hypothetical protein
MNTQCLALDLHRLDLRFAYARVAEPRAVERIARSIERGGQIVPCIAVADPPVEVLQGVERLVLIDVGASPCCAGSAATRRGSNAGRAISRRLCSASWLGVKAVDWRRSKKLCWFVNWSRGPVAARGRATQQARRQLRQLTTGIACGAS